MRVLLVEDSEDDGLLLLRELSRGGYAADWERVETPEAMRAALAGPSSGTWDVIFSDYNMPRFGGREALALAEQVSPQTPFIVVSGKVGEDAAVETLKAGAYDYVMKDNLARLCTTVARSLQEAEERRERWRTQRELRRREAILDSVRFAADRFLSETMGWEESVQAVLERLGEATGADRVYIYENYRGTGGDLFNVQRHEWTAPQVTPGVAPGTRAAETGLAYRSGGYGRWAEVLGRGEPLYGRTSEFPEGERWALDAQGILSIAVVPIFVRGDWWGFVGFDACSEERRWSSAEVGALGAAAGTLGAAIMRRQVEEQLRGSEERYRAVIEQATDGIYLLDARTRRLIQTNPSFGAMLGYSAGELRGMPVYDFVAHSQEDVDATIERTLMERRRVVGERRYRRKDGTLVEVEVGVSVIDYGGRETICTIVRDVTERKRSEEALARSENRLRTIIETEPECVKVLGMDGSLLEMNPAGLSMIEADSLEQVRGNPVYDYIAPEHREAFVNLTKSVLRGGSGTLEFELIGLKGTRRWLDTHAVPLRDPRGEIAGLLAITRNISERKRNEEALRQSEKLYRAVIEQATENIFLIDVETRGIVESNPAFREAIGYSEEELLRMTLYDIVAADRESVDANIRLVLEGGGPSVGERRYRRKDGTHFEVEASGSIIFRDGRATLCAVAHDVTERARAQRLLEDRVATLSRIATDSNLDLPTREALDAVAGNVVRASTAVACVVVLADENDLSLRLVGSPGLPAGYAEALQSAYVAGAPTPTARVLETRRPLLRRDFRRFVLENEGYAPLHRFMHDVAWDTVYSVPLVSRGRALGAIHFCYLPDHEPGEDEKVFLGAVADQAAVVVENARLFSEARDKAALEERQRLARELHDSVSQALYGIALGAKTARDSLSDDDALRASEPIDYVLTLAEAGMAEMRALIFELRPESLETEGLVAALEKQAAALRARHGIGVRAKLCGEPEVPPETKEALYRIVQEALHNTVKHARAENVILLMGCSPDRIIVEVSDDGVGFDPGGDFPGHLGLRSMRERAQRLHGTLEIESAPGVGTVTRACIPLGNGGTRDPGSSPDPLA